MHPVVTSTLTAQLAQDSFLLAGIVSLIAQSWTYELWEALPRGNALKEFLGVRGLDLELVTCPACFVRTYWHDLHDHDCEPKDNNFKMKLTTQYDSIVFRFHMTEILHLTVQDGCRPLFGNTAIAGKAKLDKHIERTMPVVQIAKRIMHVTEGQHEAVNQLETYFLSPLVPRESLQPNCE
jgi:hypothetical protein